jgi:hypothetical protein
MIFLLFFFVVTLGAIKDLEMLVSPQCMQLNIPELASFSNASDD